MTEVVIVEEFTKAEFKTRCETKLGNGYAFVAAGSDNLRVIKTEQISSTPSTAYNADNRWWAIFKKD